jgi:hypothetical protein
MKIQSNGVAPKRLASLRGAWLGPREALGWGRCCSLLCLQRRALTLSIQALSLDPALQLKPCFLMGPFR